MGIMGIMGIMGRVGIMGMMGRVGIMGRLLRLQIKREERCRMATPHLLYYIRTLYFVLSHCHSSRHEARLPWVKMPMR